VYNFAKGCLRFGFGFALADACTLGRFGSGRNLTGCGLLLAGGRLLLTT